MASSDDPTTLEGRRPAVPAARPPHLEVSDLLAGEHEAILEHGYLRALHEGLLSAAYGCEVFANRTPGRDCPFVLPSAVFLPQRGIGARPAPLLMPPPPGID